MSAAPAAWPLDIETPFGAFPAEARSVVTFASGLPGFERCRRFVLITAPALAPFTCLHGLDDPQPSFLTIDPRRLVADYAPPLAPADRSRIGAAAETPLLWLCVVHVDDAGATVNLRAPIVVNPSRMAGVQLVDADGPFAAEFRVGLD
jgi:flagellar assembly factor FliW